jgi:PAS domain S-box-containing protein
MNSIPLIPSNAGENDSHISAGTPTEAAETSPTAEISINILVVDDEPKNLTVLETVLGDPSYRVVRAHSADEALLLLIDYEFALLILDIRMPGMTGFELAQMIKARKKTAHIPIIFLTAYYNEDQHVLEGYDTGAVDYLHKPVNPTVLRSKVSVFAQLYRANREIANEVAQRREIEEQLRKLNGSLEERVAERTAELHLNQFRLRQATDAARLTYIEFNFERRTAQGAENFEPVMGFPLSSEVGVSRGIQLLLEHVVSGDVDRVEAHLRRLAVGEAGDGVAKLDYRVLGDDLVERWIQSECFAEFGPDGRCVKAFMTNLDVTALKCSELALRVSEQRFRQLADSMPQMVWTALPNGQADYYNRRWYDFTSAASREPGDIQWEALLHPDDVRKSLDGWHASLKRGINYEIEHRLLDRRSNRYGWYLSRAIPVRDESDLIVKWFGTFTDIELQKRTQEDLRLSNEALEQFAFAASHDLQEPLRNVAIFSELLKCHYGAELDEQAEKFLEVILNGSQRMSKLVSGLLAYTLTATGDQKTPAPVEPQGVFEHVLMNLDKSVQESAATITHDNLVAVAMQEIHLEQILQNLIGNAIKYRKPDTTPLIHVSASRHEDRWRLAVRDNGIGIAPLYQPQVFDLFKRLHGSGGRYSGTGIGLAICQRIVTRYGGRIWVESIPGEGSTFFVEIPSA